MKYKKIKPKYDGGGFLDPTLYNPRIAPNLGGVSTSPNLAMSGVQTGSPSAKPQVNGAIIGAGTDLVTGLMGSLGASKGATNVVGGIGKGAAAGAALGPWGIAGGALIGGVTSLLGNAQQKRIDEQQKQQDAVYNNQMTSNITKQALVGYNQNGVTTSYYKKGGKIISSSIRMANGGPTIDLDPSQYEVEKGEVVQGDANLNQSTQLSDDMHLVGGERHENGGTNGIGGERVFSDRLKLSKGMKDIFKNYGIRKPMTYADIAKAIGKTKGKAEDKMKSNIAPSVKTGQRMLADSEQDLDVLFNIQEASKMPKMGTTMFANGGNLNPDDIANGVVAPDDRAHWNGFVDFVAKKGYAGKAELDKKDTGLSRKLFDEYSKQTGKAYSYDSYVPAIQKEIASYRDNSIKKIKAGQMAVTNDDGSVYKGDVNTYDYDNKFMPGLSNVDNWAGSKTTSWKFPKAYLTENGNTKEVANNLYSNNKKFAEGGFLNFLDKNQGQLINGASYLANLASINKLDTNVKRNYISAPVYNYTNRSGVALNANRQALQTGLKALGTSSQTVNASNAGAMFAANLENNNQIVNQENMRKDAYDNAYNSRADNVNYTNTMIRNDANDIQQGMENEKRVAMPMQARNAFLQGYAGNTAMTQKTNLDKQRLLLQAYLNDENGVLSRFDQRKYDTLKNLPIFKGLMN